MKSVLVRFMLGFCVATTAIGCAVDERETSAQSESGQVGVEASALTFGFSITSMVVESGSSSATLAYDSAKFKYRGAIGLPSGLQNITVKAYADTTLVGVGSAEVLVEANKTAAVTVRVLDTTGGQTALDAGPFITSLTSPSNSTVIGQTLPFTVNALDANGDTLAYQWTSNCGGSFSDQAATTSWQPEAVGSCRITVTTSSNGLSDSESLDVVVFESNASQGAVSVDAEYGPRPFVSSMILAVPGGRGCNVSWSPGVNAMCPEKLPLQRMPIYANAMDGAISFTDNCGGTFEVDGNSGTYTPVPGLCTITATATSVDGLSSSLSMSFYVE